MGGRPIHTADPENGRKMRRANHHRSPRGYSISSFCLLQDCFFSCGRCKKKQATLFCVCAKNRPQRGGRHKQGELVTRHQSGMNRGQKSYGSLALPSLIAVSDAPRLPCHVPRSNALPPPHSSQTSLHSKYLTLYLRLEATFQGLTTVMPS